jgi:hypothetical protein
VSSAAFALLAGVVYALLGIAGLFPAALSGGRLFATFPASVPLAALHLVLGIGALAAATHEQYARRYARYFAVALLVLAFLGLAAARQPALERLALAGANIGLHLVTAALAVYFGWRADIPVLHEEHVDPDRRRGPADRRETVTTVSRERRHGAYDRRMPLGT